MNRAIGILGGTFSPIHYGHLRPAEQIRQQLALTEIRLVPCHRPPHREAPGVSSEMRAQMVELACQEFAHLTPDLSELARDEPSYTVVTLAQLQQQLPNTPLCFLMGMDSLLSFKSWHKWQEILSRCHLIVSCRPGYVLDSNSPISDLLIEHQTSDPSQLHQSQSGLIYLAQIDQQDISSTEIRASIAQAKDTFDVLPTKVAEYIRQHKLYQ